MIILAIESSCDDTSVSIVKDGRTVLSQFTNSQIDVHNKFGGVLPDLAARKHCEFISAVTQKNLDATGLNLSDIDVVAVTYAPGLIGSLLVGVNFAKALAYSIKKPLIPVHHIKAHIAANYITHPDLKPPFMALVISGGHTHIIEVSSYYNFKIIGKTQDDAIGETYDKVARVLNFPYPGGLYVDQVAQLGNPEAYKLPYPKAGVNPFDFSFSGLKTSVLNLVHNIKQKGLPINHNDIAASFQHIASTIVSDKLISATIKSNLNKITISGGVACNSEVRNKIVSNANKHNLNVFMPTPDLCTDNASMVASQAYNQYISGYIYNDNLRLNANSSITIEQD